MNAITIAQTTAEKTMSSLEIAELTGKQHKHVLADIRTMLDSLGLREPDFRLTYVSPQGKELPCYHLPKNLTFGLVAGYSAPLRMKIIDRWMELERKEKGRGGGL